FSGGLGWMLILIGQPNWLGGPPLDLILPEGFTFLVLYAIPHLALARTFLMLGLLLVWRGQGGWLVGWLAGLCWMAMAMIVPFYVLVVYAIVGSGVAVDAIRRSVNWHAVWRAIVACALAAMPAAYAFYVFSTSPIFSVWSSQNQVLSPHPLHYLLAYALVGGLALVSLRWAWQRGDPMWRRLVGWTLFIPPLLYLPFNAQRRLIESWPIPVSILASVTLVRVVLPAFRRWRFVHRLTRSPRYTSGGLQRWALSGILLLTTPTFGLLILDQTARVITRQWPIFHAGGEVAAIDWLSTRVTYADVVLCAYATGNYLPARTSARVFVGHGPETIHLAEKLPLVAKFYAPETDDAWRRAFLGEWGIDWVVVGPFEHELGTADLSGKSYLQLLYDAGGYQIYRVSESASRRISESANQRVGE
ncbi:MAG TPA: hypothetical protein VJ754_01585, partial [Anaerolineae bacterium]|nr:hypothetical protein [Anaerolineae bacterium]